RCSCHPTAIPSFSWQTVRQPADILVSSRSPLSTCRSLLKRFPVRKFAFRKSHSRTHKISIDINCDLGEGAGNDEALMPYISSANIACGYHAGSPQDMRRLVTLCLQYDVAIGAHPGFNDPANFGRIEL